MAKRTVIRILLIICVLIVAALIVPTFVNWNSYKAPLLEQINKHANFNIAIDGDIKLSLLPSPELSVSQVSVKNDSQTRNNEPFIKLKKLSFAVDFLPLLRKKISIKSIELIEPIISIDPQNGESNKVNATDKSISKDDKQSEKTNVENSERLSIDIRKASIVSGSVTLIDSKTKKKTEIKAINVSGGFSFTHGFDVSVSANIDGLQVSGTLKGDKFVDNVPSVLNAELTLTQEKGMRGLILLSAIYKNGIFEIKASSDGIKLPLQFQVGSKTIDLEKGVQFNADTVVKDKVIIIKGFKSKIEDINLTGKGTFSIEKSTGSFEIDLVSSLLSAAGKIGFDLSQSKPMLIVDLASPQVDDKTWAVKTNPKKSPEKTEHKQQPQNNLSERWSRESIDLSAMQSLNADVSLGIERLTLSEIAADKIKLRLILTNGVATIKQLSANVFDGNITLAGTLDSKSGQLALDAKLASMNVVKLPGVKGSVLKSGVLNLSGSVRTNLTSVYNIVNQLDGVANLDVSKGVVEGVDIKQFIADLKTTKDLSGLSKLKASFDRKADIVFNHVRGDIKFIKGVVNTHNFEINTNEGVIKSTGNVDLPNWKLALSSMLTVKDVKIIPTLGVNITGTIDQPQFALDMNQLQKALVQMAASQLTERAKDEVKKRVVEQLGSKAKGKVADKVGNEAAKAIGKILPGLFG